MHSYVWRDVTWRDVTMCDIMQYGGFVVTRLHTWHDFCTQMTWRIYICDVLWHDYVRRDAVWWGWWDSFTYVTWRICACDMTHSYVWRDVTWLCATWRSMAGVAWRWSKTNINRVLNTGTSMQSFRETTCHVPPTRERPWPRLRNCTEGRGGVYWKILEASVRCVSLNVNLNRLCHGAKNHWAGSSEYETRE